MPTLHGARQEPANYISLKNYARATWEKSHINVNFNITCIKLVSFETFYSTKLTNDIEASRFMKPALWNINTIKMRYACIVGSRSYGVFWLASFVTVTALWLALDTKGTRPIKWPSIRIRARSALPWHTSFKECRTLNITSSGELKKLNVVFENDHS